MSERLQGMLGGYASDTLDAAEQRELFQAALDDQAIFDALAGEQPLRDLLDDPAIRSELARSLAPPRRAWAPPLALAAGLGAAALAGFLLTRPPAPPPASTEPQQPWAQPISRSAGDVAPLLFALAPRGRGSLSVDPPSTHPAQPLTLTARATRAANLLLLERQPDGSIVRLFPSQQRPFSRVAAGVDLGLTQSAGAAGSHVLRLLVFPTEIDPLTLTPADVPALESRLEVIEARYQVVAP